LTLGLRDRAGGVQPLHFVAFVILGSRLLDIAAYGLTALGFAAAEVAYVRRPARR